MRSSACPDITAVPSAPAYIEGVINLRGRIVFVVDLRKRFGRSDITPNKKNRILVVELGDRILGLIVNSASEVLKIPPSEIEAPTGLFQEDGSQYVTGVGKLQGRLVLLLDLQKILKTGELAPWASSPGPPRPARSPAARFRLQNFLKRDTETP